MFEAKLVDKSEVKYGQTYVINDKPNIFYIGVLVEKSFTESYYFPRMIKVNMSDETIEIVTNTYFTRESTKLSQPVDESYTAYIIGILEHKKVDSQIAEDVIMQLWDQCSPHEA